MGPKYVTDRLGEEDVHANPRRFMGRPETPPGINGLFWARCVNSAHSKHYKRTAKRARRRDGIPRRPGQEMYRFVAKEAAIWLAKLLFAADDPDAARNEREAERLQDLQNMRTLLGGDFFDWMFIEYGIYFGDPEGSFWAYEVHES